jgi:hypothetical protein
MAPSFRNQLGSRYGVTWILQLELHSVKTAVSHPAIQTHKSVVKISYYITQEGKGKCKVHPRIGHEGPEGE